MKYLEFYKKCLKTGELPGGCPEANGLCEHFDRYSPNWLLIQPTQKDLNNLMAHGLCDAWWASEMRWEENSDLKGFIFNPLRQNIVLLLAAMNNEL